MTIPLIQDASKAYTLHGLTKAMKRTRPGRNLSDLDIARDVQEGLELEPDGKVRLDTYLVWLLRQHGYGAPEDDEAGAVVLRK